MSAMDDINAMFQWVEYANGHIIPQIRFDDSSGQYFGELRTTFTEDASTKKLSTEIERHGTVGPFANPFQCETALKDALATVILHAHLMP